jgi:hypothetical protein
LCIRLRRFECRFSPPPNPIQSSNPFSAPPSPLCHCAGHPHLPPLRVAGWGVPHPLFLPKPWVALYHTALSVVWYLSNPRQSVCRVPTSGFSNRRPVLDVTINRFNLVQFSTWCNFQLGAIFNLVQFW